MAESNDPPFGAEGTHPAPAPDKGHRWQQVVVPVGERAPAPRNLSEYAGGNVSVVPEELMDDPREHLEWFQRLPDAVKEELREAWRVEEGESRRQIDRRRKTTHAYVVESAVCLAFLELFLEIGLGWRYFSLASIAAAGAIGAVGGLVASTARSRGGLYGVLLATGWILLCVGPGGVPFPYYVITLPIPICVGVALGTVHRLQLFDGSET